MNTIRFTPPILWSRELQTIKSEASVESQYRNHAHSIALAILFLITNILILNSSSSVSDCQKEKDKGRSLQSPSFLANSQCELANGARPYSMGKLLHFGTARNFSANYAIKKNS